MKMHIILFLALVTSCAGPEKKTNYSSDKTLRAKAAPEFLLKATPTGDSIDDVEYFIKKTGNVKSYELKYEEHDAEVSLHFDEKGNLLEKEQDIKFSSLDGNIKDLIRKYLHQRFGNYEIEEAELRTTKDQTKLIDVEVSHHEKPTGLTEVSFTPEGKFVSEEIEDQPQIETLN